MTYSGNNSGFINYIYDRYRDLTIRDICLVFEGRITHQVMKALTGLMEEQMEEMKEKRTLRRVYHVMVESLQNINRHAETFENDGYPYPGRGVVLVTRDEGHYRITTGNIIETSNVEEISLFLGRLNNMDPAGLDELYMRQMRDGVISAKGGAGLGFIDVRRKTAHPLDYDFIQVDKDTSFFIFTATISRQESWKH
ncbi:MAG TPA: hypothetical protein ENO20_11190 [Bacteroides sp.]|nr:hypothetical protein [Bacteroides sp.]